MDTSFLYAGFLQMRHILHYTKTYPQLLLHPLHLVIEFPAIPVYCIEGDGVVVEGEARAVGKS